MRVNISFLHRNDEEYFKKLVTLDMKKILYVHRNIQWDSTKIFYSDFTLRQNKVYDLIDEWECTQT